MAIKILAVDDEEDFRVIIRDILQDAGYEVILAKDGEEGLECARNGKPSAVLVDWMMPKLDGQALVREIRRLPALKDIPILMLTVKQTTDDEIEALHFGVDDFIVKPFEAEDLLARLRAVLRRSKG